MHIITMLFLLSILVLVHELGHFTAARMLGIKVDKFGFGLPFGPILYQTNWGSTKILIHALLLGGYVSFPDDDPESDIPKDDPGRISNRKIWERFLVIIAGVSANVLIAYIIVFMVAIFSGGMPSGNYRVFIEGTQPEKTLAANRIGIKSGDEILTVNGARINSPYKFIELKHRSKQHDGYVSFDKTTANIKALVALNPSLKGNIEQGGKIKEGINLKLPAYSPEEQLEVSDNSYNGITKIEYSGEKLTPDQLKLRNKLENKSEYITDGSATLEDIAKAAGDTVHPVNIVIKRENKVMQLPVAYPNKEGILGVRLKSQEIEIPVTGVISATRGSWYFLYRNTSLMVGGLVKLVIGQIPFHDLHGIVAITKVGSDIIEKRGLWDGLLLTALISMDLAIVNLLPIPALDGGHLLFLLIEKLRGRPVNEQVQESFARVGFIFLIGLMLLIVFNDIWALITDKL